TDAGMGLERRAAHEPRAVSLIRVQSGFNPGSIWGFESYRAEWFDSTASTMMGPVMVMRHPDPRAALTDEVDRFQAEIRRLALAAAHEILRQELDRRLA